MTAICAALDPDTGKVWVGGDSAGVRSSWALVVRADAKVFTNGPFVMGFTSSFRMGQLLRWNLAAPVQLDKVSDERYMSTVFVDAVRDCLKAGGFAKKENEVEQGGEFVVGYRGQIWSVESDYQVGRSLHLYAAVGSGAEACLGAMHALDESLPASTTQRAQKMISAGLHAAETFNAAVRRPFTLVREP